MKEKHPPSSLFPSELVVNRNVSLNSPNRQVGTKRSIGAILVDAGVLTVENASRIVEFQRKQKIRFGEAAQALGLISEGDIRYALSYQYKYSYLPRFSGKLTNEELVAAYKPFSHAVDQLRAIRSQLMLQWFNKENNQAMLAILGAGRAEGGSYLAANLAIVFAQMGERTLLIDADMRAPRQHELFQLNNQLGFSTLLAGRSDLASAVMRISYIDHLDVLPAGPKPPNPQELLNRPTLNELFQYVRKAYDIVLIDTSSVSSGADALIVAAKAGAALAVARANETKLGAFSEMIEELRRSKINVVGSVLNNPPLIDVSN